MAANVEEIEINSHEKPITVITSDKFNHAFKVQKTNDGFIFYEVVPTKGPLPSALAGRYARMKDAVNAVLKYEANAKVSKSKKRDARYNKED